LLPHIAGRLAPSAAMMRFHAVLGVLAVLVALVAITFTWQPGLASLYDDSVSYLIMAQVFSPFDPASVSVASAFPNERYPPFFPLVLALSGGSRDWHIAHVVVAASFAASVYLLGWYARRITGSGAIGVAAALVFALMPGSWLNVKGILSEFPYMVLVFATLVAYDRLRVSAATAASGALLGALLAAVLLTRTIGVALVAAVAIAETLQIVAHRDRHRLKASAWMIGIPVAAAVLWYGLRPSGGEDAYVSSSVGVAAGAAGYGVAWLFTWMHANASALVDAWLNALLIYWGEPWKPGFLIACCLGAAGLLATLWRAWLGKVDGLYCVIFILILLPWPYPGQMYRLAFPVVPLVMVNAFWAAQRALSRYRDPKAAQHWAAWGAVVPLALCIPPVLFFIVERAAAPEGLAAGLRQTDIAEFYRIPDRASAEKSALLQNGVFGDMVRLRNSTPDGARIISYMPNYVALLAHRRGVPLERPANGEDMVAQVRKLQADYVYLASVHPRDSATRLGNPLDAYQLARPFTELVWYRGNAKGDVDAVLLAVDRKNLASE
jgi:hypothetical protein